MTQKSSIGIRQEATEEIMNWFAPVEGETAFYYGKIRNGKTYSATADILELLERGEVVYANWHINWDGFDERDSFFRAVLKFFFRKQTFFKFDKSNFHYFSPDLPKEQIIALLGNLVNVHIFIDEGQWMFNSHLKNHDDETRKLILHNGHYCRSLNIISQRPSNVMKDMRSQINVWYKCEKRISWPFLVFQRTTFEDMKDDLPNEEMPSGRPKTYIASKRVLKAYSTHAMRGKDAKEEIAKFEVYSLSAMDRFWLLLSWFDPRPALKRRRAQIRAEKEQQMFNTGVIVPPPESIRNVTKEETKGADLINTLTRVPTNKN